jgi:hypothetical protein
MVNGRPSAWMYPALGRSVSGLPAMSGNPENLCVSSASIRNLDRRKYASARVYGRGRMCVLSFYVFALPACQAAIQYSSTPVTWSNSIAGEVAGDFMFCPSYRRTIENRILSLQLVTLAVDARRVFARPDHCMQDQKRVTFVERINPPGSRGFAAAHPSLLHKWDQCA